MQKKIADITITDKNKNDIKIILTHLYRKGVDKIQLKNVDENIIREIKDDTTKLLLGFEMTEQSEKSCTIENWD